MNPVQSVDEVRARTFDEPQPGDVTPL